MPEDDYEKTIKSRQIRRVKGGRVFRFKQVVNIGFIGKTFEQRLEVRKLAMQEEE